MIGNWSKGNCQFYFQCNLSFEGRLNSYDIRLLKKSKSKFSRVDFSKPKIISSLYGRYTNLHIIIAIPEWSTVLSQKLI